MSSWSETARIARMKRATITEAKNRLSALLAQVRAGETIVIVDRGVPVARLEPAAALIDDVEGRIARLERGGMLRPARDAPPIDVVREQPPTLERGGSVLEALLDERRTGR